MRNTIIVTVLLFIGVIAASIFYFRGVNKDQHNTLKPLKYLPDNTFFVASIKNDEVTDNIFKDFDLFEAILGKKDINLLKRYKNMLRHEALYDYIEGQDIFISFHPKADSLEMLFTVPTSTNIKESELGTITNLFAQQYRIRTIDTLDQKITTFSFGNPDTTLYTTYYQHVIFASYSKDMILSVINKGIPKLSEKQIDYFIHNNSKNTPFSVYFPHQNYASLVKHFQLREKGIFSDQFQGLEGQSAWNINFKQDALMLTGESELQNAKANYLALFRYQTKSTQRLYNYFPANTAVFMEYSISNYSKFATDLEVYFEQKEEKKKLESTLKSLADSSSATGKLPILFQHNFALIETVNQSHIAFIGVEDTTAWKETASSLLEETEDKIYRFKSSYIPYAMYGDAFKTMSRPYVSRVDNVLVLANSATDLRHYLISYKNKDLLTGTLGFKNFEKLQGNEANVTLFVHNKNAFSKILYSIPSHYQKNYRDKENYGFQDFFSWSIQLSGNNGNFASQLYALYKSKNALGTTPEWTYELDNKAITAPYVFEQSDSSQFILIQELDHTLHAIHPSGKKMWSSVVSGRIIGDMKQLKDRSIVFVTDKNRLYRINTEGKPLKGFSTGTQDEPVAAPLVTSLHNKDIFLVPTRNTIYAIDVDGNRVSDWKASKLEGTLLGEIKQIGSQYLIGTTYGRAYILNADGSIQQEIDIPGDVNFKCPIGIIERENNSYDLVAMDDQAKLYIIQNGNVSNSHSWKTDATKNFASFINVQGNSVPELILIQDNKFQIVEVENNKAVMEYHFTKNIDDKPQFFKDPKSNENLIGIASKATNLLYIFGSNNSLLEGFPVEGQPLFYYGKINYNSDIYLLCTRRDRKLYAFRHQK